MSSLSVFCSNGLKTKELMSVVGKLIESIEIFKKLVSRSTQTHVLEIVNPLVE